MTPAQAQYRALVSQIAAQRDEFTHPQQLGPLSNAQRAVILEANADIAGDLDISAEGLADVFRGHLDPGLQSLVEPLIRRWLLLDVQAEVARERELLETQRFDADEYGREPLFT